MNEEGALFLEEQGSSAHARRRRRWLRRVGLWSVAALVAIVGTVVAIVVTSGSPSGTRDAASKSHVLAALSATVSSGSYQFTYEISSTAPAQQTAIGDTASCAPPGASALSGAAASASCIYGSTPGAPVGPPITGSGTTDTSPFATVTTAQIGGCEACDVTLRVDSTDVYYDVGSLDANLTPPAGAQGLSPVAIDQFAGISDATIGNVEGAWSILYTANPDGYLDLTQDAITTASETGTGTVDGVAVTEYHVTVAAGSQAEQINLSPQEKVAIAAASQQLQSEGYIGTTVDLSIDGAGFIRHLVAVASFNDGATTTTSVTFSDFGCAGTVLMPGQTGSAQPGPCADAPAARATTTTSTSSTTGPTTPTTTPGTGSTTSTTTNASPTTGPGPPTTTPLSGALPPTTSTSTADG